MIYVYLSASLSPFFLALLVAFPFFLYFFLLLSCIRQTSLWIVPFLGLLNPSTFSQQRYPILVQLALLLLSPVQPYQLWLAALFWHDLLHIGGGGDINKQISHKNIKK